MYKSTATLLLMLFSALSLQAQYTVTGGGGTPLLARDDTPNKLQVYLVYGMDNVEISFTSTSASHQWYRYKLKAATDNEPVPCEQQGTTSVVRNLEEGYGYYVKTTETIGMNNFVWIIDYSKYAFDIQDLQLVDDYPCDELSFKGTATLPPLVYYTPAGTYYELEREFEVSYNTLKWDEDSQMFVSAQSDEDPLKGSPFKGSFTPPYADTDIKLSGDQFARHFGVEKSRTISSYQAVAIYPTNHIDTTAIVTDIPNMASGANEGYSAPVDLTFTALANTPVVAFYRWDIIHAETRANLRVDNSDSFTFTFNTAGQYVVSLQLQDRTGTCTSTDSITIFIGESFLFVPNAFSPGASPGVNDEFRVAYKSLVSFKCWIFNRWGVQLYYWTDPAKGWDGKQGGKYVAPGVYFYVIEAKGSDGRKFVKKGNINIIRPKNVQDQIVE